MKLGVSEKIDRDEEERIRAMFVEARRNRPRLTQRANPFSAKTSSGRKRYATFMLNIGTRKLGLTREGAAAMIINAAKRRALFEGNHSKCVIHVKDGKPLTEVGAKLLSEWNQGK